MTTHTIDQSLATSLGAMERAYQAGEKVFLEDEIGGEMFVVTSGRIDVITYGTVLDNVRAGGIFGEMALIDDGPRSAAAIAAEPSTVIAISKATFLAMVQHQPEFALRVMRALSERLRKMNRQL
ncbi:MAG: cyclic nucleotide-binding domain-containing protein [Hyphomicrobium sp.]